MKKYKVKGDKLGPYPCVTMEGSPYDTTLAGSKGEIWLFGQDDEGNPLYKGYYATKSKNEKCIYLKSHELKMWKIKLRVPVNPEKQVYWANNPNARLGGNKKPL